MGEVIGRPVDIEITTRAHALLSASSAERWLTCTPSARIEETMPDRGSSFATDGTAAHAFAETRLRYLLKQITKAEYLAAYDATKTLNTEIVEEWNHADWDAIDSYVQYVMDEHARLGGDIFIEKRVDYSKYAQGGFGTSDVVIVSHEKGVIKSIDLKFGKGVPVYADDNPQAKLYALGSLLALSPQEAAKIENVEWAIVQPRLDSTSEDGTTTADLIEWAETVVQPAAEAAWEGEGKLVPTTKGCRFCKAAGVCRARIAENVLIARRDFMMNMDADGNFDPSEHLMDMDEVAKILPDIDGWLQWANSFKAYALTQARDKGAVIPGYKLVRGRSNRQWDQSLTDLPQALRELAVSETDIFEPPKPPAPRSVAQLEKVVGKKAFEPIEKALVVKPLGTPALVQVTDPRPAMNEAAEAAAEFGATS